MNSIKKLIVTASLAITAALTFAPAQAGTIYSSVYVADDPDFGTFNIANMTFNFNANLIDSGMGLVSTSDDAGFSLTSLSILGDPAIGVEDFEAIIDVDNFFSGLFYVYLDATDLLYGPDNWAYQLDYMQDGTGFGLDIFGEDGGFLFYFDNIVITSTYVSEPAVAALMLLFVGGATARRRRV